MGDSAMKQTIAISGLAGSGKNEEANVLISECGWVNVSFADKMKRICKDLYGFTDEQLWGPSEKRNAPDLRYPRFMKADGEVADYLTPRLALQELGSWGRKCYPDVWAEYAMSVSKKVLDQNASYHHTVGLLTDPYPAYQKKAVDGVVISDLRFRNELEAVKRNGGKVWRVVRPGAGLEGEYAQHESETEQLTIPDSDFDLVIHNEGTLDDLKAKVRSVL
jgi:hypothetical protein